MKLNFLTLALLAGLTACNRDAGNNVVANQTTGLPTPTERPAVPAETTQPSAMPAGLDCVRNRLSPEQRRDVAAAAMEQAQREDPRMATLFDVTEACGDELNWSQRKRQLAGMFSMSAAGATGLREMFASRGIRIEQLDRTIITDRPLMAAVESGQLSGTAGQEFAMRHIGEIQRIVNGESLDGELGTRVGNYIAFRALAEAAAGQFGRTP